ncbi:hypothetical protein STEG23_015207 [Scotinomys teguina]
MYRLDTGELELSEDYAEASPLEHLPCVSWFLLIDSRELEPEVVPPTFMVQPLCTLP